MHSYKQPKLQIKRKLDVCETHKLYQVFQYECTGRESHA